MATEQRRTVAEWKSIAGKLDPRNPVDVELREWIGFAIGGYPETQPITIRLKGPVAARLEDVTEGLGNEG